MWISLQIVEQRRVALHSKLDKLILRASEHAQAAVIRVEVAQGLGFVAEVPFAMRLGPPVGAYSDSTTNSNTDTV